MEAKKWMHDHYDELIEDLRKLIQIESVQGEPQEGMPFGKEVNDALLFTGEIAEKLGFTFHNVDGYVGYFDYEEKSRTPEVGIITHVDVVPPVKGEFPSFDLTESSGNYYGRGVLDDKGPTIISIYALAALKATGFKPKKNIRMLWGTNEESGWADIAYYNEHEEMPKTGFSPDADYPVINHEKGIMQFNLKREHKSDIILSAYSGKRPNMVPAKAECTVKASRDEVVSLLAYMNMDARTQEFDNTTKVTFMGVSAHASQPEHGVNAAKMMVEFLGRLDSSFLGVRSLFQGINGFGLGFVGKEQTLNLGGVFYEEGELQLVGDMRFPSVFSLQECQDKLEKAAGFLYEVEFTHAIPPHEVDADSHLVQSLIKSYEEETGEKGYAMTIGGGTFARCFEEGVAFGCLFPGEEMTAHQADELFTIESFKRNMDIMVRAIYELTK